MESNLSLAEVVRAKDAEWLAERARQELLVNAWAEKLALVDKSILVGVELPEVITLKTLIPELYAENPVQEVYDAQYEKFCELCNKINNIIESLYEESKNTVMNYHVLASEVR